MDDRKRSKTNQNKNDDKVIPKPTTLVFSGRKLSTIFSFRITGVSKDD